MADTQCSDSDTEETSSWVSVGEDELGIDATNAVKSNSRATSAITAASTGNIDNGASDLIPEGRYQKTTILNPARYQPKICVLTIRMSEDALVRAGPRFFQLPRTVRERIYALILVEPTRWNKRHKGICILRDRVGRAEDTPFDPNKCNCFKRTGLGILKVSKCIHDEAAPVLYGMNTWCYINATQVVHHLQVLRPNHAQKIRHVSIMGFEGNEGIRRWASFLPSYKPVWYGSDGGIWDALMQFRALRSLELRHEYFPTKYNEFGVLVDGLPDLERVTMVALNVDDQFAYGRVIDNPSKIMHKVELDVPLHSASRKNTINRLVSQMSDPDSSLKHRLLNAWRERLWVNEPWMSKVPGEWKYDDEHEHAMLLLGERQVRIRLYGQPNSLAIRKWIVKEEKKAAAAEKALGWPTRAENIAEQVRQRNEEWERAFEQRRMSYRAVNLRRRAVANEKREMEERSDRIKREEIVRNERKAEWARQQEEMKNERKRHYREKSRKFDKEDGSGATQ